MPRRVIDIRDGKLMVVSDLHGDRDAFARHVGRFLQFRSRGRVDKLLLLGDLIHSDGPESEDGSLGMIQDVMRMQASLGAENVMMLLGNHELVHIYGLVLRRGDYLYTPRFERALTASGRRAEIMAFLHSLPFYARTAAGVAFAHAGPDGTALLMAKTLFELDHQVILDQYSQQIAHLPSRESLRSAYAEAADPELPYEILAQSYLAVSGPDDPRYDDLLRGFLISQSSTDFSALWDAIFTRCEKVMLLPLYTRLLDRFLAMLSEGAPAPQHFIVTGHIDVIGGHQVVCPAHLRIASAKHAHPRDKGEYLLFDAGSPVNSVEDLEANLGCVYGKEV